MSHHNGYSAKVGLNLIADGVRLNVAQVCPDRLYLQNCSEPMEPCTAKLVINIDGRERSREIFLYQGIRDEVEVAYF